MADDCLVRTDRQDGEEVDSDSQFEEVVVGH